ncbi:MAG: BamA/TamA family outer membrane protein [Deltaproteobacteria bacterium]|nr:BamA/TamA family outer membrane protein [Deltaproteobacteria bacterium]
MARRASPLLWGLPCLCALSALPSSFARADATRRPLVSIEGQLQDDPRQLLRALALPTDRDPSDEAILRARQSLDELGYRVAVDRRGGRTVFRVAPYTLIRRIYVKGNWPLFEEEIVRRLGFRPGQRLPEGRALAHSIALQRDRLKKYLEREGYFDGDLHIRVTPPDAQHHVNVYVRVNKGRGYKLGGVEVEHVGPGGRALTGSGAAATGFVPALSDRQIERIFQHRLLLYRRSFNTRRFAEDVDELLKRYHRLNYPGARVKESFRVVAGRPADRAVQIKLRVQQRKRIVVTYRGNRALDAGQLDEVLTLKESGSYDDYELEQSAKQIHRLYQSRGYLQARTRFTRTVGGNTDWVTFWVDEGPRFRVERVELVGHRSVSSSELRKVIKTRPFPWLGWVGLGEGGYITDLQLRQDTERLVQHLRDRGFPDARVFGDVAPAPELLGHAGALAAVVGTGARARSRRAYVRFVIHEGAQVMVRAVSVLPAALFAGALPEVAPPRIGPRGRAAEADSAASSRGTKLHVLEGRAVADKPLPLPPPRGEARLSFGRDELLAQLSLKPGQPYVPAQLERDKLRLIRFYAERGFPGAKVQVFEQRSLDGRQVEIQITVQEESLVRFGPIFVRGNFRTRERVIRSALGFREGQLFDIRKLEAAEKTLRDLKMFNAVLIRPLAYQTGRTVVPILVRVEDRYDDWGALEFGVGGSSDNPIFGSVAYVWNNVLGFSTTLSLRGEVGPKIQSITGLYSDPRLLGWPVKMETQGFYRNQITARLGDTTSYGGTLTLSKELLPRLLGSVRYEFRQVQRKEPLNRPTGIADEASEVDVPTRTGAVGPGLVYDHRDSPLAPTRGFYLGANLLFASRALGGSDDFLKVRANGQLYVPLPLRFTLAVGVRYDHGIPFGGAVLLPKVERFFAGGDSTIRGFEEDRAFAERVELPASPYGGVSLYRVLPQGGNIRILGNLELQFPIWKDSPIFGLDLLGAAFLDSGVVFNSYEVLKVRDFRHGAGVALRLVLPVGFASFEYAFPLDPTVGDPRDGRFHFNFGFIL